MPRCTQAGFIAPVTRKKFHRPILLYIPSGQRRVSSNDSPVSSRLFKLDKKFEIQNPSSLLSFCFWLGKNKPDIDSLAAGRLVAVNGDSVGAGTQG